jgi:hypothetical protein
MIAYNKNYTGREISFGGVGGAVISHNFVGLTVDCEISVQGD